MNKNFLNYLKAEYNYDFTENGAKTNKSTFSRLLDLFALIGSYRDKDITDLVKQAWLTNKEITAKILIHTRNIVGGYGERDTFRRALVYLYKNFKDDIDLIRKIIDCSIVDKIGRWDDYLYIAYKTGDSYLLEKIKNQYNKDINSDVVSLLGKWLYSENASSEKTIRKATYFRKLFGLKSKEYRQNLTKLREKIKIIENNLRLKDYTFNYENVPSKAFVKYRKAFIRNDEARFQSFIDSVEKGEVKINTGALTPFDVIHRVREGGEGLDALWNNLPDMFEGEEPLHAIVAADVSGSMDGEPVEVSVGLALYMAERNKGYFHNHFIDFCGDSQIHEINPDEPIVTKYTRVRASSRDMNTNIDSVFKCLLDSAVKNKVEQKDLPKYVIIISDMEFDCCRLRDDTNFSHWKNSFEFNGYKLPIIVFWNVNAHSSRFPATKYDNVILMSGRSQTAFKTLTLIEKLDLKDSESLPLVAMLETLKSYDKYL